MTATGTTPPDVADEKQAARWVQRMFAQVAPRYDLLNHLLSFNIDRVWRKALLDSVTLDIARPGAAVLDLCCGTGDVLLDLQRATPAPVMGADFCRPMLLAASAKMRRYGYATQLLEADALELPFRDDSIDVISIAFGFRNLASYGRGLAELYRVLRTNGILAILEFSHPPNPLLRAGYGLYSRFVLPLMGGLISGSRDAYTYLPDSIRKFPGPEELEAQMQAAGFRATTHRLLTGGIAALHTGRKVTP